MLSENTKERLGFIDLAVAGDLFRLTAEQREQMVRLVTADLRLSGLRSDGSLPVAVAVKLALAAVEQPQLAALGQSQRHRQASC